MDWFYGLAISSPRQNHFLTAGTCFYDLVLGFQKLQSHELNTGGKKWVAVSRIFLERWKIEITAALWRKNVGVHNAHCHHIIIICEL